MEEVNKYNYISETNPNYKLTVDEMWKTININNGIEGYEIHKKYFDFIKAREFKKIWERCTSGKVQCKWPPIEFKDKNGDIKWPKRKNYLDDVIFLIFKKG